MTKSYYEEFLEEGFSAMIHEDGDMIAEVWKEENSNSYNIYNYNYCKTITGTLKEALDYILDAKFYGLDVDII